MSKLENLQRDGERMAVLLRTGFLSQSLAPLGLFSFHLLRRGSWRPMNRQRGWPRVLLAADRQPPASSLDTPANRDSGYCGDVFSSPSMAQSMPVGSTRSRSTSRSFSAKPSRPMLLLAPRSRAATAAVPGLLRTVGHALRVEVHPR
jgi:hypothetical protein